MALLQLQCVELLLLLGHIHLAAGAPLTALPYVLSCLLHSTDLHMDLLVSQARLVLSAHMDKALVTCVSPGVASTATMAGILRATTCMENPQ